MFVISVLFVGGGGCTADFTANWEIYIDLFIFKVSTLNARTHVVWGSPCPRTNDKEVAGVRQSYWDASRYCYLLAMLDPANHHSRVQATTSTSNQRDIFKHSLLSNIYFELINTKRIGVAVTIWEEAQTKSTASTQKTKIKTDTKFIQHIDITRT